MTTQPPAIQVDGQDPRQEEPERGRNHHRHADDVVVASTEPVAEEKSSRRRSIIDLVERLRSRSRSHSRNRSLSRTRTQDSDARLAVVDEQEYEFSRRKSGEMAGEYEAILRAQVEYMETLRQDQAKNGVTHNVDGIPIPPPVNPKDGRRRSIIAAFSRSSSRSRPQSQSRPQSRSGSRHPEDRELVEGSVEGGLRPESDKEYRFSKRKSAEISGPYAETLRSQLDYMEDLREEQAKSGITHNADGILIPPPVNNGRRSSVTAALGLDKQLLSL